MAKRTKTPNTHPAKTCKDGGCIWHQIEVFCPACKTHYFRTRAAVGKKESCGVCLKETTFKPTDSNYHRKNIDPKEYLKKP